MKQVEIKLIQMLDLLEFETHLRVVMWGTTIDEATLDAKSWHKEVFNGQYVGNDDLKQYENHKVIDFNCCMNHININISEKEVDNVK